MNYINYYAEPIEIEWNLETFEEEIEDYLRLIFEPEEMPSIVHKLRQFIYSQQIKHGKFFIIKDYYDYILEKINIMPESIIDDLDKKIKFLLERG